VSLNGTNEPVTMPAGMGVLGSAEAEESRCPQYMQNAGGPPGSAVERVRRQRGQVVVTAVGASVRWAKGCSPPGVGDYRDGGAKHKQRCATGAQRGVRTTVRAGDDV
jgi:hypothetical protein